MARKKNLFRQILAKVPRKTPLLQKALNRIRKEKIINEAQQIFDNANKRWRLLEKHGYYTVGMAKAEQEVGHKYFGTFDKKNPTKYDILAELYRTRIFLNDKANTLVGAQMQQSQLNAYNWRGAFGAQYKEEYGVRYNPNIINENNAKMAWAVYRSLEADEAVAIYAQGGYGSEELFNEIYEYVNANQLGYYNNDRERSEALTQGVLHAQGIIDRARMLNSPENNIREYRREFQNATAVINFIRKGGK